MEKTMYKKPENKPWTLVNNQRILQCHSKGDTRYSPFFCYVESFGMRRSIEDHYQSTKVFLNVKNGDVVKAGDWRMAKFYQEKKNTRTYSRLRFELPNGMDLGNSNGYTEDLVIQYYIALWYKYLKNNPDLLVIAAEYDDFEDPFKGKFPFCQADVIRQASKHGLETLRPMFRQLERMIRAG